LTGTGIFAQRHPVFIYCLSRPHTVILARMTFVRPLLLSALLLTGCAAPREEEQPAQPEAPAPPPEQVASTEFPNSLGTLRAEDSSATCSVALSAPSGSPLKNQKINFILNRGTLGKYSAQEFTISTGTSKSLGQLQSLLASALRRGAAAPAGTELAKVGDIRFGGELRLVAQGEGQVEYVYNPASEHAPRLSAGEASAFAALLSRQ
jgi:hypothetical protein